MSEIRLPNYGKFNYRINCWFQSISFCSFRAQGGYVSRRSQNINKIIL